MTKGDLWDDSALTDALDQAMSKFKKKHVKGYEESSSGYADVKIKEQNLDNPSFVETDDGSGQLRNAVEDDGNVTFVTPLQSDAKQEYDLLWKEYYELEEKRLQVWEKLQQYGNWDHTYPVGNSGSCTLSSTIPASQEQYNSSQACYPAYAVVCSSKECQSSTTACCLPSCSLGTSAGLCINPSLVTGSGMLSEDVDVVKKGMEAAEKAISMLKEQASDCKLEDQSCSQREPITNGETDLTEVMNAWYSAGFYTGKYLTEKSLAKPRSS